MKRVGIIFCALLLILSVPSVLLAGGYVNKSNLSVEYLRTLNRQAATDYADIVEFNPAGTVKLKDGFTLNLSFQDQMLKVKNTSNPGGTEYESDKPQYIPALYAVYKKNQWAGFFGFNVPLGGGSVEFDQGNATTLRGGAGIAANVLAATGQVTTISDMKLEAQSFGLGFTLGGAYQIQRPGFHVPGRPLCRRKEGAAGENRDDTDLRWTC
ncbi:hypothetical protein D3OALGA1CA_3036 [Olavius algarvensis associated proteobacterium Delta 3]|nr:hypothetical protein D3OALGA1CA_3036 [Olavius algarvensis associated proteobacterium Delta 3]CAB5157695.1 hypothetical protein D3OALGB2SA_5217 [Olavius algarvensis associated proteobacterium Delta 3]